MSSALAEMVANQFLPIAWPEMAVVCGSTGGVTLLFLYRIMNTRLGRDAKLRDGILGLSLLIAIVVFAAWMACITRMSPQLKEGSHVNDEILWAGGAGIGYSACIFGLSAFVTAPSSYTMAKSFFTS